MSDDTERRVSAIQDRKIARLSPGARTAYLGILELADIDRVAAAYEGLTGKLANIAEVGSLVAYLLADVIHAWSALSALGLSPLKKDLFAAIVASAEMIAEVEAAEGKSVDLRILGEPVGHA